MSSILLEGKVRRWGNSYGILLGKEDFERLGVPVGSGLQVRIDVEPEGVDVGDLPLFNDRPDLSERIDDVLSETL